MTMKKLWMIVAGASACAVLACGCGGKGAEGDGGAAAEDALHAVAAAVPLTPEQEAKATVDSFIGALQAGRMDEIYKLLPESYQADVSKLVKTYAAKVDPALFEQASGVLATFADVLDAQAGNLAELLSEQDAGNLGLLDGMSGMPEVSADDIRASAKWLGNTVRSLSYGDCAAGNVMPLFEAPLSGLVDSAMEQSGFNTLSCAIAADDGEPKADGIVKMELSYKEPGKDATDTEQVEFVKVEGKWVPLDLTRTWGDMMGAAQRSAEGFSIDAETAGMLNKFLPMIQRSLEGLKGAQSAQELQAQAMGAVMTIGMMMQ
jgi:hypothetical protein